MNHQVITISKDGTISGLQRKPGKGVDLRQFGDCTIERVSEILPTNDGQLWYVQLLKGAYAGCKLDYDLWCKHINTVGPGDALLRPMTYSSNIQSVYYFENYDDAVAAEVEFLDAARLQGVY